MLNASDFLLVDFLNDFYVTLAQTAPFSDLPVAERRGKMDKKRMRVEMEKTEEMEVKAWEVVLEKVPWVPPPSLKSKFKIVIQLSETVQITTLLIPQTPVCAITGYFANPSFFISISINFRK